MLCIASTVSNVGSGRHWVVMKELNKNFREEITEGEWAIHILKQVSLHFSLFYIAATKASTPFCFPLIKLCKLHGKEKPGVCSFAQGIC